MSTTNGKKVLAILLSLAVIFAYMPLTSFAAEKVTKPENVKWGSDYIDTMGVWDWLDPDDDEEGLYTDIVSYNGMVYWSNGTSVESESWNAGKATDGYDFDYFINEHGGGSYSFTVKAVAEGNSGKEDSEVAESGTQDLKTRSAWSDLTCIF